MAYCADAATLARGVDKICRKQAVWCTRGKDGSHGRMSSKCVFLLLDLLLYVSFDTSVFYVFGLLSGAIKFFIALLECTRSTRVSRPVLVVFSPAQGRQRCFSHMESGMVHVLTAAAAATAAPAAREEEDDETQRRQSC